MEDHLSLPEIELIIKTARERREDEMRFAASLQGIDLDAGSKDEERAKIERRAQARIAGASEDDIEANEWADLGIDVETID